MNNFDKSPQYIGSMVLAAILSALLSLFTVIKYPILVYLKDIEPIKSILPSLIEDKYGITLLLFISIYTRLALFYGISGMMIHQFFKSRANSSDFKAAISDYLRAIRSAVFKLIYFGGTYGISVFIVIKFKEQVTLNFEHTIAKIALMFVSIVIIENLIRKSLEYLKDILNKKVNKLV